MNGTIMFEKVLQTQESWS